MQHIRGKSARTRPSLYRALTFESGNSPSIEAPLTLAFPDGEGRMGWGTKGQKQISFEIFSLFLAKLPPTEGSARRAKGVKLISKGIGLIIHWALKSKKVLRALARSSIGFNSPSYFPRASPICPVFIISFSHFLIFSLYKYTFG